MNLKQRVHYQINNQTVTVQIEPDGHGYQITIGNQIYHVSGVQMADGKLTFQRDSQQVTAHVAQAGKHRYVHLRGEPWTLKRLPFVRGAGQRESGAGSGEITASMPGTVMQVAHQSGDEVQAGDSLVVLEAMKMELKLSAPFDGTVQAVHCAVGDMVARGQLLMSVAKHP